MKKVCVFLLILSVASSCKRKAGSNNNTASSPDSTRFFQVNQFIEGEIKSVNATPYYIYKKETVNGSKDSVPINASIFTEIARQFLVPDINDPKIKKYYTENIFEDRTTKGFTITYSTKNKDLKLQNVDILLAEDGKTVNRILLRKFYNYNDSSAIEQLSWKPGESLQINRSVQKPGLEVLRQTSVVWNPKS